MKTKMHAVWFGLGLVVSACGGSDPEIVDGVAVLSTAQTQDGGAEGSVPHGDVRTEDAGNANLFDASLPDAAVPETDGGPDAKITQDARTDGRCDPSADDLPDDDGLDENCDGADGVVGKDVYLDLTEGSETDVGTPTRPVLSFTKAFQIAQARGGAVLVRGMTVDASILPDTPGEWSLYGGYGKGFVGAPKRELMVFKAKSGGMLLSKASHAKLSHVTIQAVSASSSGSFTAHALRVSGVDLVLDDVLVTAGDGVSGDPGQAGSEGTTSSQSVPNMNGGPTKCDGITQAMYVTGATDGTASGGRASGNLATSTRAEDGASGRDGMDGRNAPASPTIANGLVTWGIATDGSPDGMAGFGGPGGGSGQLSSGPLAGLFVEGGWGGDGGCPGKPGTAGQSAGGSVAILALSGSVAVSRSVIKTGFGGNGGNGGRGGQGGAGQFGFLPSTPFAINPVNFSPAPCDPAEDPTAHNCAAYGGAGGRGGNGAWGGAGAGGWTIGIVTVGDASATVDTLTTYQLGAPGVGGAANMGRAYDGQRKTILHLTQD
jgi:hypothetical protein